MLKITIKELLLWKIVYKFRYLKQWRQHEILIAHSSISSTGLVWVLENLVRPGICVNNLENPGRTLWLWVFLKPILSLFYYFTHCFVFKVIFVGLLSRLLIFMLKLYIRSLLFFMPTYTLHLIEWVDWIQPCFAVL